MLTYWIDVIDDFIYEKHINEWVSLTTIKIYNTLFNLIINSKILNINDLNSFNEINIKRFLWENLIKLKWWSETYNKYRKNIKSFCKFLVKKWYIISDPTINIKLRKRLIKIPKYLTTRQIIEIKSAVEKTFPNDDFISLRNKTVFYFYLYTWIRLNELTNLNVNDIDFINRNIKIYNWKGWKDRLVPLLNILWDKLIPYLIKRKRSKINSTYLFPTRFNHAMQHRDIYEITKKINANINFKVTPHMFRHTFATELIRKNENIYNVSKILWHSDVKTTQIYLWLDLEKLTLNLNNTCLFT